MGKEKDMKKRTKIFIAVICVITALAAAMGIYANSYYRAVNVEAYLTSDSTVAFKETEKGYFFDGPGEEKALIFYPGAKVEETAYAPLLHSLAEQGVDCFLIKAPMKLTILDGDAADGIRNAYSYKHYYLAGHSLGGYSAANYSANHLDEYDGLFLLAAYPGEDLTKAAFPVVFIYGDKDGILNRERLERGFTLSPGNYQSVIIKGGNHSNFGSYGAQKGDGVAKITAEEQQKITVDEILKAIGKE